MKRWLIIILTIITSVVIVLYGNSVGCIPETQHNGATLNYSCLGVK